jgi:16S rRNA (guanine1516-N2)-methyltransferase
MNSSSICILCSSAARKDQANALAKETGLPLLDKRSSDFDLQLCFDDDYVALFDTALNTSIHVDFVEGALAHRQQFGGGRGQAIAKAIGLKHGNTPSVLDITAGLARDAFVLACMGCKLTLVEQSPVLYTLIDDGIRRGLANPASADVLKNFMNLVCADSVLYMEHMDRETRPDVIYIDPMYPERKKSAQVKKDMQILQHLLGKDENAEVLLKTALQCAGKRVVVKRSIHAETLGDIKPSTSINSKKTRYDVYIIN